MQALNSTQAQCLKISTDFLHQIFTSFVRLLFFRYTEKKQKPRPCQDPGSCENPGPSEDPQPYEDLGLKEESGLSENPGP